MTDFFEWNADRLGLGVDAMDREHRNLIAIMNDLHRAREAKRDPSSIGRLLDKLGAATVEHFTHEETHMESIGFPGLPTHRMVHKSLLERFAGHVTTFRAGEPLGDEFFEFLRHWLGAHIRCIDRKYADHGAKKDAA